jgi:hypothetical protein
MAVEEIKKRKRIADMMKLEISALLRNLSLSQKPSAFSEHPAFLA